MIEYYSTKGRAIMDNKNEVLKGLYDLKASISGEIFELENKLYLLRSSLEEVNSEICKVGGHSFDVWEQVINPNWLNGEDDDNIYCYRRKCIICGEEETTLKKPTIKIRSKNN